MIKIAFIDGTEEVLESDDGSYYYEKDEELFQVPVKDSYVCFPREFIKSIRVIEV